MYVPPVIQEQEVEKLVEDCLDVRGRPLGDGRVDLLHGEGDDTGEGVVLCSCGILH